ALGGSGPAAVREATEAWRAAVAAIIRRGRKLLEAHGGPKVSEPRVAATLLGAAAHPETANLLAKGILTDEIEPPGFESVLGSLPKSSKKASSRSDPLRSHPEKETEPSPKR